MCDSVQTIEHLLFDCEYVRYIWDLVRLICNVNITFRIILGLEETFEHNSFVTVISFIVYKEWLLLSLQGKRRNVRNHLLLFKQELQMRLKIYENCYRFDCKLKEQMKEMIDMM